MSRGEETRREMACERAARDAADDQRQCAEPINVPVSAWAMMPTGAVHTISEAEEVAATMCGGILAATSIEAYAGLTDNRLSFSPLAPNHQYGFYCTGWNPQPGPVCQHLMFSIVIVNYDGMPYPPPMPGGDSPADVYAKSGSRSSPSPPFDRRFAGLSPPPAGCPSDRSRPQPGIQPRPEPGHPGQLWRVCAVPQLRLLCGTGFSGPRGRRLPVATGHRHRFRTPT